MKSYNQFINEGMRDVENSYFDEDGNEQSVKSVFSNAKSGSKSDILKKSQNGEYSEVEYKCHELMKKRPDLFPIIKTNSKTEGVTMGKLDTKRFNAEMQKMLKTSVHYIQTSTQKEYRFINQLFSLNHLEPKHLKQFDLKTKMFVDNYVQECFEQLDEFIIKKIEIGKFFLKSGLAAEGNYQLDLHIFNFGFLMGTHQIRCFDPIVDLGENEDDDWN